MPASISRYSLHSVKSDADADELKRLFLRYATALPESDAPKPLQLPHDVFLGDRSDKAPSAPKRATPEDLATATLSLEGFTAFLLSTGNSAFTDQDGSIHHDMTRPLWDYYVSSSHNTYLVGHQLVGDSTIEGYIRALLHSCRSVERKRICSSLFCNCLIFTLVDIYDGDREPVVYHGKTLTTKVSLRKACEAIAKYAFVVSPYPIIISAEIHCSIPQQDMIASIMREVFGESLMSAPVQGRPKIDVLPSPEDLKGRILLKVCHEFFSGDSDNPSLASRRRIYMSRRARNCGRMSSPLKPSLQRHPQRPPRMVKCFLVCPYPTSMHYPGSCYLQSRITTESGKDGGFRKLHKESQGHELFSGGVLPRTQFPVPVQIK